VAWTDRQLAEVTKRGRIDLVAHFHTLLCPGTRRVVIGPRDYEYPSAVYIVADADLRVRCNPYKEVGRGSQS